MNKKQLDYTPVGGVCPNKITIETEGDIITNVEILGGCHGNSQGLSQLLRGMNKQDAIQRLEGIGCGKKTTSCPDQIAQALKTI